MTDPPERLAEETRREIETFLDRSRVDHDVPGTSLAVLNREGVVHAASLGAREIESRSPATPDTRYSVASVTKVFTALATLQLVERGDLGLDDEIRDYVGFWNDVPGDPVTVRELLCHASGMPSDYAGEREILFSEAPPASPILTREDDLRHANGAADRRIVDPEEYLYSSRGYLILGEIVEAVAERSFAGYVEAELFAPLGMDRSQVGYGELSELGDDTATGYVIEDGTPMANSHDLRDEIRPPYSGGGILSSVRDLAAMARCLLNGGVLDGTRVLSPELAEAMCERQSPTRTTIDGREIGYGYGPRVGELLDGPLVEHTGTAPGISRAYVGLVPEHDLGVTLGANTSDVPIGTLGRGVLAIAAGAVPEEAVPALSMNEKIAAVTGTYEGYHGGLTVTVEAADSDPHLEITYEDGPGWSFTAFPESVARDDYAFYTVRRGGLRSPVRFHETDSGMEMRCNVDRLRRTARGS